MRVSAIACCVCAAETFAKLDFSPNLGLSQTAIFALESGQSESSKSAIFVEVGLIASGEVGAGLRKERVGWPLRCKATLRPAQRRAAAWLQRR